MPIWILIAKTDADRGKREGEMAAAFVGTRIQHGGKILYLSVSGSLGRDRDFISGTGVCRYGDCRDRTGTFISGAADPVYVPLFLWMMEEADKKSRQFAYLRKIGTAGKNNRRYFLCFFVALSVLFLGILTESYAGSGLVQMILRIVY